MRKGQEFFSTFAKNKILAAILVLVNLGGVAFGLYYYYGQFLATPVHLWLFVPDSPTAVFLFAAFLFLFALWRYQHPVINLFTSIYLVKVGLWSVFVLLWFWPSFFFINPVFSATLVVLHIGMILETFVVLSVWKTRVRGDHALFVLGWFLTGDFFDYVIGTVPYPIPFLAGPFLTALATESLLVTLVLFFLLYRMGA